MKPTIEIKKDDMGYIWLNCNQSGEKVVEWHFSIELSDEDLDNLENQIKQLKEQK